MRHALSALLTSTLLATAPLLIGASTGGCSSTESGPSYPDAPATFLQGSYTQTTNPAEAWAHATAIKKAREAATSAKWDVVEENMGASTPAYQALTTSEAALELGAFGTGNLPSELVAKGLKGARSAAGDANKVKIATSQIQEGLAVALELLTWHALNQAGNQDDFKNSVQYLDQAAAYLGSFEDKMVERANSKLELTDVWKAGDGRVTEDPLAKRTGEILAEAKKKIDEGFLDVRLAIGHAQIYATKYYLASAVAYAHTVHEEVRAKHDPSAPIEAGAALSEGIVLPLSSAGEDAANLRAFWRGDTANIMLPAGRRKLVAVYAAYAKVAAERIDGSAEGQLEAGRLRGVVEVLHEAIQGSGEDFAGAQTAANDLGITLLEGDVESAKNAARAIATVLQNVAAKV